MNDQTQSNPVAVAIATQREALRVLVENTILLSQENKAKLLAALPTLSDADVAAMGELFAREVEVIDAMAAAA